MAFVANGWSCSVEKSGGCKHIAVIGVARQPATWLLLVAGAYQLSISPHQLIDRSDFCDVCRVSGYLAPPSCHHWGTIIQRSIDNRFQCDTIVFLLLFAFLQILYDRT